MAVVVISSAEKGDRLDGSLEVKVPMAGGIFPGQIRTGGEQLDRPQQKRTRKPRKTSPAGSGSQVTWESRASVRVGKGHVGAARHVSLGRMNRHSRDVAYNLLYRESAARWRVGRMGSIKRRWPGEQKPGRSEDPWGRAVESRSNGGAQARRVPRLSPRITTMKAESTKDGSKPSDTLCVVWEGPV